MSDETEYEIVYTIRRRQPGEEDFTEIGFGISGAWTDPAQCGHILLSDMQNYSWEVENGMPDPEDIKADVEIRRQP